MQGRRLTWMLMPMVGTFAGIVVAGLSGGRVESLTSGYLGGKLRDIVPYVTVLVILLVRPYGLFGTRQIERL